MATSIESALGDVRSHIIQIEAKLDVHNEQATRIWRSLAKNEERLGMAIERVSRLETGAKLFASFIAGMALAIHRIEIFEWLRRVL